MYVEVENISKVIKKNTVLSNISVGMNPGKIYGLQGKNGSGKTMLMKAICGLIFPTEGKVIINGEQLGKDRDFPKDIGALIENPGFISNYSAFQNLKILADIKRKVSDEEIWGILKEVGLDDTGKKKFRAFSLGMKQKLGIAAALMENPKLIILDEPTNSLDQGSVENLRIMLQKRKNEGALIIISCHDKEELTFLSDEIFVIEEGKIVSQYYSSLEGNNEK